jgi:hypothetical protein
MSRRMDLPAEQDGPAEPVQPTGEQGEHRCNKQTDLHGTGSYSGDGSRYQPAEGRAAASGLTSAARAQCDREAMVLVKTPRPLDI